MANVYLDIEEVFPVNDLFFILKRIPICFTTKTSI